MAVETLDSVLNNLVDNARIHSHGKARAAVRLRRDGALVYIEVCDDGPGISEANQRRVFDRFFTTARDEGGSGLGLSIVKALVESHAGGLSLASRRGETVVTLCLPAD